MKITADLNTIILAVLLIAFIWFEVIRPSHHASDIDAKRDSIQMWEDSFMVTEGRLVELEIMQIEREKQYKADSIASEIAYNKLLRSLGNTAQINIKHEKIRQTNYQLDADESIRLLTRRAAAIDSARQNNKPNK